MKALGFVVSEKKIFLCFSHYKSMGANDPRGGAIFDSRGMIGRIYIEDHYIAVWGGVWTPGAWLAGFIKRTTIHCYTINMKALGLVVSEKKIFFMFFPL